MLVNSKNRRYYEVVPVVSKLCSIGYSIFVAQYNIVL